MSLLFDSNANGINGLFHIPDESSFLKKLILSNEAVYNPNVVTVFKLLQEKYPTIELIHKENYFALMLPTQSEGVQLEAMLITTQNSEGEELFSIYHRLHFDPKYFPIALIEADAFVRPSAVVVNAPLKTARGDAGIDGIASVLNYQINEALNIEITMLTLADGNLEVVENYVDAYVMNTIARYMLATKLDAIEYMGPLSANDLATLIARYADVPLLNAAQGVEKLKNFKQDIKRSEDAFVAEFASSTPMLMFLYLESRTSDALLEQGGFYAVKEFLLDKAELYNLQSIEGSGEMLGNFEQLQL